MEIKKRVLGKGLSALIPDHYTKILQEKTVVQSPVAERVNLSGLQEVFISNIKPNKDQPRRHFSDIGIEELAQSIKEQGVLQPVIVKKSAQGYEIVCGERRLRAATRAGLKTIPVVVKDIADERLLEAALVENIQREDLNAIEEAQAYLRLVEERGFSQEQVADRVGKNRATVANTIRLLRLPQEVLDELAAGRLQAGHARALLALPSPEHQRQLCKRIVEDKLSVRQVEEMVNRSVARKRRAKQARHVTPEIFDLEAKLAQRLGTQVKIFPRKNGQGRVEIHYYSLNDLDRLLNLLNIPKS
ncbi:MAG: ParB/RepB/Spo0J family partition protein [Candidatus Omnitrophica bacterium]|nr:ParB/RepB/Spo0J family partition protein [Candidatus Omnitrophota bacterium]